jgi:anthranilate phosphoribosyltransferase
VLAAGGAHHVLTVHGADGLDELSTTGPSTMYEWRGDAGPAALEDVATLDEVADHVRTVTIDPVDLGVPLARVDDLRGGDTATNAELARRVLSGCTGPHRDIVVLNAAAGLLTGGVCADLASGMELAAASIDRGRAGEALERLVAASRRA